jgi:hypothetical protein
MSSKCDDWERHSEVILYTNFTVVVLLLVLTSVCWHALNLALVKALLDGFANCDSDFSFSFRCFLSRLGTTFKSHSTYKFGGHGTSTCRVRGGVLVAKCCTVCGVACSAASTAAFWCSVHPSRVRLLHLPQ